MEPRSEAEMSAILRTRQLATRARLHRQAEGIGPWGAAVVLALFLALLLGAEIYFDRTMFRDISYGVESLKSAGVDPKETEAIRVVLVNISTHVASFVFLAALLAGLLVAGMVAWLSGRMDAILKLISENAEPTSGTGAAS